MFVVFENGLAKRSPASEWNVKGRAQLGVAVAKLSDKGGDLVGALTVDEDDEVLVVMEKGNDRALAGRRGAPHRPQHEGVKFAKAGKGDAIVGSGPQRRACGRGGRRGGGGRRGRVEVPTADDGRRCDVTGTASGVVDGDDRVSGSGPAGSGVAVEGDDAVPSVDDEDEGGRE